MLMFWWRFRQHGPAASGPAAQTAIAVLPFQNAGSDKDIDFLRLALPDEIATSLSRTGVATAALGMALTAMIGVTVMVDSFRESLHSWLLETLRADVYVSAPGFTEGLERRLDPQALLDGVLVKLVDEPVHRRAVQRGVRSLQLAVGRGVWHLLDADDDVHGRHRPPSLLAYSLQNRPARPGTGARPQCYWLVVIDLFHQRPADRYSRVGVCKPTESYLEARSTERSAR